MLVCSHSIHPIISLTPVLQSHAHNNISCGLEKIVHQVVHAELNHLIFFSKTNVSTFFYLFIYNIS